MDVNLATCWKAQKPPTRQFKVTDSNNNAAGLFPALLPRSVPALGSGPGKERRHIDFVEQLEVFVSAVEQGSFARAANALGMGRPTVTHAVAGLEASLGTRLFNRSTRRSSLTAEGELFYQRATQILADVRAARHLFGGTREMPRGRLRVDIPVALAKALIIPHLPAFMRRFPDIELIMGVSDQPVDLLADGVDCVLRLGDLSDSRMVSRKVVSVDFVTCAAPSYLAAHGTPETIDDLAAHRAVIYFAGKARQTLDWHCIEDGKERIVKMRAAILVNDTEAFVACGVAGIGLIQAIRASVDDHLASGRLVEVLPLMTASTRQVSIVYPNRQHVAPQVRAFIDWISETLSE